MTLEFAKRFLLFLLWAQWCNIEHDIEQSMDGWKERMDGRGTKRVKLHLVCSRKERLSFLWLYFNLFFFCTTPTQQCAYSRPKVPTASSGRGMVIINCCSCSVASKGWNYSFILCFYQGIRKLAMIILWDTGIENMFPGTPIYHLRRNNGREAKMRRPSCHYIDKRDDKHWIQ